MGRRRGGAALGIGLGLGLCGVAALPLAAFFAGQLWVWLLVGAAVVGGVVGLLLIPRRIPLVLGLPVAGVLLFLLVTWVLFPGPLPGALPDPAAVRESASALLHGWSRMLSVGVPAEATAQLLVLPVTVAAGAGLGTVVLLRRSRGALVPLTPAFLLFVLGLLLGAVRQVDNLRETAAFLGVAVLLVFLRAARVDGPRTHAATRHLPPQPSGPDPAGTGGGRRRSGPGRVAVGLPVLAVVCVLAVVVGSALPVAATRDRFDPRRLSTPPLRIVDVQSPLLRIKSQLDRRPPAELFTVRFRTRTRTATPELLRVATLSDFDGVTWRNDGMFAAPGARLDTEATIERPLRLAMTVTVGELPGPWLPVVGQPERIRMLDLGRPSPAVRRFPVPTGWDDLGVAAPSAFEVAYSARTATLVARRSRPTGLSYTVDAAVPVRDDALADALPDTRGAAAGALALPRGVPEELVTLARQVTARADSPYAKLVALRNHLRRQPYGLREVPPGHSYAVLARTFGDPTGRPPVSSAEQHAAAFVVMARSLGFPARVAVGYRLTEDGWRGADTYTVTTSAAHAWAEVSLRGYGWFAVDPTDVRNVDPDPPDPQESRVESAAGGPPPAEGEVVAQLDPSASTSSPPSVGERAVVWAWSLVALLLGLAVSVWLAKAVRRRRRRWASRPSRQIVGAWREVVDRLTEAGLRPDASLTPEEVAISLETGAGNRIAAPVYEIAPIIARAAFAPAEPRESDVTAAWRCERVLRRALAAQTAPPVRWQRRVDPRPLLTHRRTGG